MGPAELLDYDRQRLRALVLEEGGTTSHVAIVARALGIPAIGQVAGVIDDLPSVAELIARIMSEAEQTLKYLGELA